MHLPLLYCQTVFPRFRRVRAKRANLVLLRVPTERGSLVPAEVARNHHPQSGGRLKSLSICCRGMSAGGSTSQGPKRKNLNEKKAAVICHLRAMTGSKDGIPRRGAYKDAAGKFGCHWQSTQSLWRRYRLQNQAAVAFPDLAWTWQAVERENEAGKAYPSTFYARASRKFRSTSVPRSWESRRVRSTRTSRLWDWGHPLALFSRGIEQMWPRRRGRGKGGLRTILRRIGSGLACAVLFFVQVLRSSV